MNKKKTKNLAAILLGRRGGQATTAKYGKRAQIRAALLRWQRERVQKAQALLDGARKRPDEGDDKFGVKLSEPPTAS